MTLAVLADPHVAADATGTWKVYHRTAERLRTAVAAASEYADAAIVAGDLTRDGHPAEFDAIDDALAGLSVPWTAIPGNHDVPKSFDDHETPAEFGERYDRPPYTRECGDLTVLGLNTASAGGDLRDTWGGRVGADQRAWLADRLREAGTPLVVSHHPVAALPDLPAAPRYRPFQLQDADAVADVLTAGCAGLVVSAHHHVPAVASHGDTVEALAPATCSFPQASLHVEVDPRGTTLRLVPLADRAGLAEAHGLARDGKPLGRTVLKLVERRLGSVRNL